MSQLEYNPGILTSRSNILKFLFGSFFGIFMFFANIKIGEKTSIPLDHIVTWVKAVLDNNIWIYVLCIITVGAIYPFYTKTWNKTASSIVFSILRILGAAFSFMIYFGIGPSWLFIADIKSLVLNLLVSIGLIMPIGSIFLSFLMDYGLLEFIGVLMQPVMKPIFKTPGRSSVDAVTASVASYSISLLITNKGFREGKYTIKEAAIIATGFSTVSATFMVVLCKTLGLMEMWNFYFWSTIIIKFIVTAVTARLYPLNKKEDKYFEGRGQPEIANKGSLIKIAFNEGLKASSRSVKIGRSIISNFKNGLNVTMNILPTTAAFAVLGLLLSTYTPLFDYLGYIYYPFFKLFQIPEALLASKAAALSAAECFITALLISKSVLITKYIIGVVVVAGVIMFSGPVPCMMSTDIPFSIPELILIWFERTVLIIILSSIIGLIFLV